MGTPCAPDHRGCFGADPEGTEAAGECWALWPDGTMCRPDEVEAMLRPPCAFSDDYVWVWHTPEAEGDEGDEPES
jgi:hypothetical protein